MEINKSFFTDDIYNTLIKKHYMLFKSMLLNNKRNKAVRDEKYMLELIKDLKVNNVTPFELSKIYGGSTTVNEFKLIFLELVRKKIFIISKDKIYINDSMNDRLKEYELKAVEVFNEAAKKDDPYRNYITMDELLIILNDSDSLISITQSVSLNAVYRFKDKYKKKIKALRRYFNIHARGYSSEIGEIISKYTEYNFIELENLYYMASEKLTTSMKENDYYDDMRNSNSYYNDAFSYMDYHSNRYVKNSNNSQGTNCSGCFSCTSCSGCGGGGAD